MIKNFLLLGTILFGAFNIAVAQTPQALFKKYRQLVCEVEFFKNVSSQSEIGSYIKIKQSRIGILVGEDGLVMVNSDVYPLSLDIISGDGASFYSGEPTDFKVKMYDGSEWKAEFLGKDDLAQVAFIKITDELPEALPYVSFASSEALEIGQVVYLLELLGEQYHFQPVFTPYTINAIIEMPRRKFLIKNAVTALSAGGLVITGDGKAVGVTLSSEYEYGYSAHPEFEEPLQELLEIGPSEWFIELIKNPPLLEKSVYSRKAWLGIGMQALTPELKGFWQVPAEGGVVLDRIYPNSPADKSGLKVKDVIIRFNDRPIDITRDEDLNRFREMITQNTPGSIAEVLVFRNAKTINKKIELAAAPRAIDLAEKYQSSELGLEVRELTRDVLYSYDLPLNTRGVYVYQVDRASPAGLGGLEIGSILTHVNGDAVDNLNSFKQMLTNILKNNPKKIMFQVQQSRETRFVFIDIK